MSTQSKRARRRVNHNLVTADVMELERRQMLAADAGVAAIVAEQTSAPVIASGANTMTESGANAQSPMMGSRTVVFIDSEVVDPSAIADALPQDAMMIVLNSGAEPLQQITASLAALGDVESLHIISHGQAGAIRLGGTLIDSQQLHANRQMLSQWRNAMTPQADILLYGCDVAASTAGRNFVDKFAEYTGMSTAASNDATGNSSKGGDWQFEYRAGDVDTRVALSDAFTQSYAFTLPITVYAAGETGEESMSLQIDGVTVKTWENVGGNAKERKFETFTYEHSSPVTADRVRVVFNNDYYDPGIKDRNLYIDRIEIDGTKFETEDKSVLSTGTWTQELGIVPGFRASEALHAEGYMQFSSQGASTPDGQDAMGEVRSIDGTGNNLLNPEWGSTGEMFLRIAPEAYEDGVSSLAGSNRPSPREISNALVAQSPDTPSNSLQLSSLMQFWGQFIDHDLDLTPSPRSGGIRANIAVPTGDSSFDPQGTGTQTIAFTRSNIDPATGTGVHNPAQQINGITAWIDASMVYGSDQATANSLRSFSGGKMKTSAGDLLPVDANGNFLAGDIRVNENIALTALQVLFVREHNRWADHYLAENPSWSDERVYQAAREMVIAEIQAITYNEFLPTLLGEQAMGPYRGYDPTVNPNIANEFATAAYRFGHSLISDDFDFFDDDGNEIRERVLLKDAFFNPNLVKEFGIDTVLKYTTSSQAQEIDTQIVDSLRNFLFGNPGSGGLDLASLNIQRGRDHGLADYNTTREAYGLARVSSFAEITSNVELQQKLEQLYGSVDNIDLWVGGLAEDHAPGSAVGELVQTIVADQFYRVRAGDRFWYENSLSAEKLALVRGTSMADIIAKNTTLRNLQDNVFVMRASISGTVFVDSNRDGDLDRRERGQSGLAVELLNSDGEVISVQTTDKSGRYQFANIEQIGKYQVRVTQVSKYQLTTPRIVDVTIAQGDTNITDLDFGLRNKVWFPKFLKFT
jgi:peroxidase